jgi:uncharacterized protein YbcV (DUF1398 family)
MISTTITTVQQAQRRGAASRPRINGFPHYAEALRAAGISAVETSIATGGSVYYLADGAVTESFEPIVTHISAVPDWNEAGVTAALRADQEGRTTFPEFLRAAWDAGVIQFRVDLAGRTCTYVGAAGEHYVENYPAVAAIG